MEPSKEFVAAAQAKVKADREAERRRISLAPMIATEVARGVNLSTVGKLAGYTPEHVRRIARAHGVEAAVDRRPPILNPKLMAELLEALPPEVREQAMRHLDERPDPH